MPKRIYIVTFAFGRNFGSLLKATGMNRYVSSRGHSVSFVYRFQAMNALLSHPSLMAARLYNRMNKGRRKQFFKPSDLKVSQRNAQRIKEYIDDNYDVVSIVSSARWRQCLDEDAIFIAGSDIIWQPYNGYPEKYFLDFAHYSGLTCFSYASSLGSQSVPKQYCHAYRKYLRAFKGVAVREEAAVKLLEPIVDRKSEKVVDPTLLLTREDWNVLANRAELSIEVSPFKYVLCYFVMGDERYWSYVEKVREATGLQVVVLPMNRLDQSQPYAVVDDATPYEFIWLIKNAAIVVTDSFHACVFATIYEREFYLLPRSRKAENDKYDDFLSRYGLLERKVSDESGFVRAEEIDWGIARRRIDEDRAFSMGYLSRMLEDGDEHVRR